MSEQMIPSVESFAKKRTKILQDVLIYGVIWQLSAIGSYAASSERYLGKGVLVLLIIQMIGWIGWMIAMFRMSTFGICLRKYPDISSALEDEFYQAARVKAFTWACWAALVCQGALVLVSLLYPFSAEIGALITILVITTVAIGSFLALDRS